MIRRAQPWLGTLVEIRIGDTEAPDESRIGSAINAAFAAIADVHRRMSFHDPASELSAINRLAVGDSIEVDASTAQVLRCALLLEQASEGIFNLSCGQRLAAWGYLPAPAAAPAGVPDGPPDCAVIEVDANALDAPARVRRLRPGWIDLGGIAKGHAVDRAVETLQGYGVTSGCVNAGGDLRAFGPNTFPVTVRDPRIPTRVGRALALQDRALATSACYFSRRDIDGVAYSALIDGADGRPVVVGTSASVQAPRCMLADGLTKIVMATGDPDHPLLARFEATAFII